MLKNNNCSQHDSIMSEKETIKSLTYNEKKNKIY